MLPYCQLPQHSQNKGTDSVQFCKLQTKPAKPVSLSFSASRIFLSNMKSGTVIYTSKFWQISSQKQEYFNLMDGKSLPTLQRLLVFPFFTQSDFQSQINMFLDSSCSLDLQFMYYQFTDSSIYILCLYCMVLVSSLRGLVPFSFLSITEYRKTFIFVKKKNMHFERLRALHLSTTWAYCAVFSLKIRPLDCVAELTVVSYCTVMYRQSGVGELRDDRTHLTGVQDSTESAARTKKGCIQKVKKDWSPFYFRSVKIF
jgi:hypothetical protein